MEVEVDLFSGRPNPRFRLTPEAASDLSRRLARLPSAPRGARVSEGLGYRGLRLTTENLDDPFAEVVVSNGLVLVRDQHGQELALADPERSLERWLAEVGAPSLDPDVAAVLRQQLTGGTS
jgi:hypothetical protein